MPNPSWSTVTSTKPSTRKPEFIADFVQQEPNEGQPTTEKTEVWLFYDDRNIYVSARCWDSEPDREIANEMRRDGQSTNDNESFAVVFDTFYDRRNAFLFQTTLAGGLFDGYITDERDMNRDWNTVWDARSDRTEDGYAVEMVIPFKSLRFKAGDTQVWGVNFKRVIRWKNELAYLTPIPAALGRRGMNKISSAATLVGIETPKGGRNFELKPYGISGLTTLRPAGATAITDPNADAGFDVKVGLTDGLTADFTYNTDFAQVEEDEQQVNLTRFNVIFPEKREFFLEGAGIFSFGGLQGQPRGGGGGGGAAGQTQGNPNPIDIPVLFFSRRIGLATTGPVPIDVGGRVAGKAGRYSLGLIDIRTGDEPLRFVEPTNFGVVRVKRDVLRRSAVGVLFHRSIDELGGRRPNPVVRRGRRLLVLSEPEHQHVSREDDRTRGALTTRSAIARSWTTTRTGTACRSNACSRTPSSILTSASCAGGPSVAIRRTSVSARGRRVCRRCGSSSGTAPTTTSPARAAGWNRGLDRPRSGPSSRTATPSAWSTRSTTSPSWCRSSSSPGVVVPAGAYSWPELHLGYNFGPQRRASGFVNVETGNFYDGTRTGISTGRGRVEITPQISVEPTVTLNWVDLPSGSFTSALLTTRVTYALSPRMSAQALVQFNSTASTFNTNVRYRWEYRPGSDLFVVYTDNRDTTTRGFPEIRNRGLVVKVTRLFRL